MKNQMFRAFLVFTILALMLVGVQAQENEVPRNRTFIAGHFALFNAGDMWSPYNLGGTHQQLIQFFYEPLSYADNLNGNEYPWLAESWEYNEDATELTYFLREGVFWSDGEPFTAEDVAYTFNTLRDLGSNVRRGGVYPVFVKEAEVVDDLTVKINFNIPSPRFHNEVVAAKGDSATFIVPEHVWNDKDWAEYTAWNDGAGPVTTGAWRVVFADERRRVIDSVRDCDQWWACATGFEELPAVERMTYVVIDTSQQQGTALINNELDETHDVTVEVVEQMLAQNPNATTWTGREGPFGMVSWWPTSLWLNNGDPHLGKAEVRHAINRYLDRELIMDFAFNNQAVIAEWPFPPYAGLQETMDTLEDLRQEYDLLGYNPDEGDQLLTDAGYIKDGDGFWADASGERITCEVIGIPQISDLGPVVAETLRQHGIDSSYEQPTDFGDRWNGMTYQCALFGHNGSQSGDIYQTLALYTTESAQNRSAYSNPEYDAVVAQLEQAADIETVRDLEHQAMAIWLRDLPEIPMFQFFNRVGRNTTYWTNFPSTANPYMNGISPHTGFPYILLQLEPTDA